MHPTDVAAEHRRLASPERPYPETERSDSDADELTRAVDVSTAPNYERIVVATDAHGDNALAISIAAALGVAVGAWELLTIATDHVEQDCRRLEDLTAHDGLKPTCTTIRASHIASAIVHHMASQPQALLVISSTGRRALTRPSDRHPARNVLAHTDQPTLVVGPHADSLFQPPPATLVVCVNTSDPYPTTIAAVDRWRSTFSSDPPWIVEVVATVDDQAAHGHRDVQRWATVLEGLQVPAKTRVLHGGDPVEWLDEFAARLPNPVYVATSRHYSDPRRHLHSVTGDLIRRSHHPVLVVPDHRRCWRAAGPPK